MKKMQIIGHRGAAGLALENTMASFEQAVKWNLMAIEFDVRLTKDKQLIVFHDADLQRIADDSRLVNHLTLRELRKVALPDGSRIPTLREALAITKDIPAIVEIRDNDCTRQVFAEIQRFKDHDIRVASRRLDELRLLRSLDAELFLYSLEHTRALENIHLARMFKLNGVGMNFWLLNPLTYWYARRRKLAIYVYTVNSKPLARFLSWLYPDVAICTDHPEWFVTRRRIRRQRQKGSTRARRFASHSR
jgi:glycerophosphoryl diester phosphodiesterase